MLALFIHLGIFAYCYRKFYVYNWEWEPCLTAMLILFHQFIILFYWVGDIEFVYIDSVKRIWIWILIFIFYFIIYFNIAHVFHRSAIDRNRTHDSSLRLFLSINYIVKECWKKNLLIFFNDSLKKEWYNYQVKYNKTYKIKLFYFIYIFSLLLLLFRIFLVFITIFLIFVLIHFPFTPVIYFFEKKFLIVLIYLLIIFFIYNFLISLFFKNTKFYWIFFFFSYELWESFTDWYKYDANSDFILTAYGIEWSTFYICGTYKSVDRLGNQKRNLLKEDWKILFTEKRKPRYKIPLSWYKINYEELDCYSNTPYFKLWLNYQLFLNYFIYPWLMLEYLFNKEFRGKGYSNLIDPSLSYASRFKYEKNLKKYKIK
jgi:hypothetical protein